MTAPDAPMLESTLLVVGTGVQWGGQMTLAAQNAIIAADRVLFAQTDPWGVRWIRSLNANAVSLAYPRDGRPRREIYATMTKQILAALGEVKRVCVAFYGSPTFLARAAHDAIRAARQLGYRAQMLPGVSSIECLAADLGVDFGASGYQLFEANDFLVRPRQLDVHSYLVLCQIALIGQRSAFDADASRVRRGLEYLSARLQPVFGPHHRATIYEAAPHSLQAPRINEVELCDLGSVELSEVATLCVPPIGPAPIDHELARAIFAAGNSEIASPITSRARVA